MNAKLQQRILQEIHSIFPSHSHILEPHRFKMSLNRIIPECEARLSAINAARREYLTNHFNEPFFEDEGTAAWYGIMKAGGMKKVLKEYSKIEKRLNQVKWILSYLA